MNDAGARLGCGEGRGWRRALRHRPSVWAAAEVLAGGNRSRRLAPALLRRQPGHLRRTLGIPGVRSARNQLGTDHFCREK
jgi:hypothetical protein